VPFRDHASPKCEVSPSTRLALDLLDARDLLDLLDRPEDIPALASLIEQEILYRLLHRAVRPRLLQIGDDRNSSNKIAQAMHGFERTSMRPLRIAETGRPVGMSMSHYIITSKRSQRWTPMQYKQLRLTRLVA